MLAYSQVDQAVRRKLEELLKTWREPVAGSLSSTPVFPHNATQSIIDALGRFKAATAPRPSVQQIRPSSVQPSQYQPTPLPQQLPYVQTPQIQLRNPTPIQQPIYPPQIYSQVSLSRRFEFILTFSAITNSCPICTSTATDTTSISFLFTTQWRSNSKPWS